MDNLGMAILGRLWGNDEPKVSECEIMSELKIPVVFRDGKILLPFLQPVDRFIRNLIQTKPNVWTMLVVGFKDAAFMFYLGLEGFQVDGLESEKTVKLAKMAQNDLPLKHSIRFNFNNDVPEQLEKYPVYDIIVNFCLEKVKDPKQVMAESLKHLKLTGYAYFTSHIEQNVLDLIPEGFVTETYQVIDKRKNINCFIIEVRHKK